MTASRLRLELAVALVVTVAALLLFLNGSLLSTWNSLYVDFSINYVASHALRDGSNPYGITTLMERARDLDAPTNLLYSQLFTSYIQPPTSAVLITPFTLLPWPEAGRAYLLTNHLLLATSLGLTVLTVRPQLPLRWTVALVSVMALLYSQVFTSFVLGQVDATIVFLLALAFWAYTRRRSAIAGGAISLAMAIKLIPGLLLLYFLWRREYRIVLWGAGIGLALLLVSLAYTGGDVWRTYLTETLPALLKGSSHYSNASLGALIARAHTPEVIAGLPEVDYLGEIPANTTARLAGLAIGLGVLVALATVLGVGPAPTARDERERTLVEFYLVVAAGLLISSVTWEFYLVWLLPALVAIVVSPGRLLPAHLPQRIVVAGALVVAFIALNYPADIAQTELFADNDVFYHPHWLPGVAVEDALQLYHRHLDAVIFLRLPALLLVAGTFSAMILLRQHQTVAEDEDTGDEAGLDAEA